LCPHHHLPETIGFIFVGIRKWCADSQIIQTITIDIMSAAEVTTDASGWKVLFISENKLKQNIHL
jgi:hypothetical protein